MPLPCYVRGMNRERISTTVDAKALRRARASFDLPDSKLFDRALAALLSEIEGARERAVLTALPYEDDPALAWAAPPAPPLPYDGDIPDDVQRLAAERRAAYEA